MNRNKADALISSAVSEMRKSDNYATRYKLNVFIGDLLFGWSDQDEAQCKEKLYNQILST